MTLYTVHWQKGWRVGTRALRMFHIEANTEKEAIAKARKEAKAEGLPAQGYKFTGKVDTLDDPDTLVELDRLDDDPERYMGDRR